MNIGQRIYYNTNLYSKNNKIFIYALVEPGDNIPKYFGSTNRPEIRLYSHIEELEQIETGWLKYYNKNKISWIRSIRELNQYPEMIITAIGNIPDRKLLESTAIVEAVNRGYKLLNSEKEIRYAFKFIGKNNESILEHRRSIREQN